MFDYRLQSTLDAALKDTSESLKRNGVPTCYIFIITADPSNRYVSIGAPHDDAKTQQRLLAAQLRELADSIDGGLIASPPPGHAH